MPPGQEARPSLGQLWEPGVSTVSDPGPLFLCHGNSERACHVRGQLLVWVQCPDRHTESKKPPLYQGLLTPRRLELRQYQPPPTRGILGTYCELG